MDTVSNYEFLCILSTISTAFSSQHEYQVFNYDQLELSFPEHITVSRAVLKCTLPTHKSTALPQYSCQTLSSLAAYADSNIYTIIGEWTTAPTDCAKWLNGRGVGARWDGTWQPGQPTFGTCANMTGDMSNFSDDYKTFLRQ